MEPKILRTPDAAKYVGLAASTLEKLRTAGGGPKYVKIGVKLVGYTKEALDAWLGKRTRTSTSDRAGA